MDEIEEAVLEVLMITVSLEVGCDTDGGGIVGSVGGM